MRILCDRNAVAHDGLSRGGRHEADGQSQAQHQFVQFHSKLLVDEWTTTGCESTCHTSLIMGRTLARRATGFRGGGDAKVTQGARAGR